MTEFKTVKIQSIIESQIPEFFNEDYPLFREFLQQYYISQEYQTGIVDLAKNLNKYKSIDNFNNETFFGAINPSVLTSAVLAFDDTINVSHTIGFPDKYGLFKINDEIITYTGKTETSFTGCIRGFSGIDSLEKSGNTQFLQFTATNASEHSQETPLINLNLIFFEKLFTKFKSQFLPGFENRNFYSGINLQTILSRAKDFYISKGTDTSFQILFSVLFGDQIQVIKPKDYTLRPSDNNYFNTKNILVEIINGGDITELKGKSIFQTIAGVGTASAAVYNVEYRPVDEKDLYEISLDPSTFNLNFNSTKRTNVLENVSAGSSSIFVDSTVGFKNSGTFLAFPTDYSNPITINYTDKTINQFLGVSGLTKDLKFNDRILEDNFLYSYLNDGSIIKLRLINIINSVDYANTSKIRVGDKLSLSSFGVDLNNKVELNSWIYNLPTTHQISSIISVGSNSTIRITLKDNVKFLLGENILLVNTNDQDDVPTTCVITKINSSNTFEVQTEINLNIFNKNVVSKIITKGNSLDNKFPEITLLEAGVQNTYSDYNFDNFYVASSGIPNYQIESNINKVSFSNLVGISIVETTLPHNLVSGERIYFHSDNSDNNYLKTGKYFVKKVNDTQISLAFNQSDLFSGKYIDFSASGIHRLSFSANEYIIKEKYYNQNHIGSLALTPGNEQSQLNDSGNSWYPPQNGYGVIDSNTGNLWVYDGSLWNIENIKKLQHQKLLKKFNISKEDNLFSSDLDTSTSGRPIGLFVNGIEIYSPTVFDESIFYGELDNIVVQRKGSGYDVINRPGISIEDLIGSDAKATANVTGSVEDVRIISPGIGYQSKPKITIEGGNGSGAVLEPNLIKQKIKSPFKGNITGVDINNDVITFIDNHYFENAEEVSYNSNGNPGVIVRQTVTLNGSTTYKDFNLSDNSTFFVGIVTTNQIKLYNKKLDALTGINTVDVVGISSGIHYFTTLNSKNTINKIYIKEKGSGYSNKSITISSGISTYDNYITARGHNFKNEDIVVYSYSDTSIGGLSDTTQYIVTIIDKDNFKLSEAGIGTQFTRDNYINKEYVKFTSSGIGSHTFSYPPISIKIETTPGISQTSIVSPVLEPIILGSIDSVFIEKYGIGYGTSEIINFHRKPLVTVSKFSSEALLKPIISNGQILEVQILNYGNGYGNDVDIIVDGKGKYAEILPIMENGKLSSVKILNSGVGYDKKTTLTLQQRGSGVLFEGNVFEWKINQVVKNKNLIKNDDNFIFPSDNNNFGLKVINFYAPKKLRLSLNDSINGENLLEENQNKQSPILGWSYDGYPIYGPYAQKGSKYDKLNSSYSLPSTKIDSSLRPNDFDLGYFIQDYEFNRKNGDLDQYNGKFSKTKEFPNGTYAYYITLDDNGNPAYPYVISNNFKRNPIKDNFNDLFNQNSNLESIDIIRNIGAYYINSSYSNYGLIDKIDKKYKQEFIVKKTYPAGITSISIFSPGNNYKVQDRLVFDNKNTGGSSSSAVVERISGKNISNINIGISTFSNVSFYNKSNFIFANTQIPHNLLDGDQVLISSISNINFKSFEGFKTIRVNQKIAGITSSVKNASYTGVSTFLSVTDISGFNTNDIIHIDDELLRITSISAEQSRIYVNRDASYTGVHTAGISSVVLVPTEFSFIVDEIKYYSPKNTITYFNPYNSVGYGTTGTSYTNFDNTNNFIPEKRIYIPKHSFYTGQPLTYNVGVGGNGDGLSVSDNGIDIFKLQNNQTIYSATLSEPLSNNKVLTNFYNK